MVLPRVVCGSREYLRRGRARAWRSSADAAARTASTPAPATRKAIRGEHALDRDHGGEEHRREALRREDGCERRGPAHVREAVAYTRSPRWRRVDGERPRQRPRRGERKRRDEERSGVDRKRRGNAEG